MHLVPHPDRFRRAGQVAPRRSQEHLGLVSGRGPRRRQGSVPGNANCLKCHQLAKIPDEQNGVRMSHKLHVRLRGLKCADCHDSVSHTKPGQSAGVTMQTCPMCHNEQGAPDRCDFCHSAPPPNAHRPDYLKEHGREARLNVEACLRCHHDKQAVLRRLPRHPAGGPLLRHLAVHAQRPRPYRTRRAAMPATARTTAPSVTRSRTPPTGRPRMVPSPRRVPSACLVCHPQSHVRQRVTRSGA